MSLNRAFPNRLERSAACSMPFVLKLTPEARPAKIPFSLATECAWRSKITVVTAQGYRDLVKHTC